MGERQSKAYWQPDADAPNCNLCGSAFSLLTRRHHCRNCGFVFCKKCTSHTCPIIMRGMNEPVRVCDSCFAALVASMRGASAPPIRAWHGLDPNSPDDSSRLQRREASSAPAVGCNMSEGDSLRASVYRDGADSGAQDALPVTNAAGNASADPSVPSQPQQHVVDPTPTSTDATEATAPSDGATAAGPEDPINEEYQDAYGAAANNLTVPQQHQQQHVAKSNSGLSPEQMEREILARQWAAVRQEAQFVDILVQRAEKVEPTSMVEYSRETEAVILQPEVPVEVLGATVLPLPQPVENSARYLMEPVKLWTRNNNKQLFALDAVAASIATKLQPPLCQDFIRRAHPTHFAES